MENRRKNNSSNSQTRCKKHPKHQQSPGVCSICLREKLSQISKTTTTSSRRTIPMDHSYCSSSLSSLSSSSHSSPTSELSPVHRRVRSWGSGAKWSKFAKSRSMANFVGEGGEGNKKSGFWSKLLRPKSIGSHDKKNHTVGGGFAHSRTMRERILFTSRVY